MKPLNQTPPAFDSAKLPSNRIPKVKSLHVPNEVLNSSKICAETHVTATSSPPVVAESKNSNKIGLYIVTGLVAIIAGVAIYKIYFDNQDNK